MFIIVSFQACLVSVRQRQFVSWCGTITNQNIYATNAFFHLVIANAKFILTENCTFSSCSLLLPTEYDQFSLYDICYDLHNVLPCVRVHLECVYDTFYCLTGFVFCPTVDALRYCISYVFT